MNNKGERNSQFGTCWIYNESIDKKIKKTDLNKYIEIGWIKGRKHTKSNGWKNHKSVNWSKIQKESYKNGNNFVAGGNTKWLEILTSNGLIKVQGSYELRTVKILENWKAIGTIFNWEYTSDRFQYINIEGKQSTYLLDFKVWTNKNDFYYIEVKGFERPNDQLKWKSVEDKGYKLKIWFLKDIKKEEEKIECLI